MRIEYQKQVLKCHDAERQFLGSLILYTDDSYEKYFNELNEEYFLEPQHKLIFRAIKELYNNSVDIDPITIKYELSGYEELKEIIIMEENLYELANECQSHDHIHGYYNIIQSSYACRKELNK